MNKKYTLAFVLSAAITLLSACQTSAQSSTSSIDLRSTEWSVDQISRSALSKNNPTIVFGADSRITGNASCNRYTGTYTLNGEKITINGLVSTRKACISNEVMQQEQHFLQQLGKSQNWSVQADGRLALSGANEQIIAHRVK